mgnify:CR=1 FL=1
MYDHDRLCGCKNPYNPECNIQVVGELPPPPKPVVEYVPPKRELPKVNIDWDYLNALEKLPQTLIAPQQGFKGMSHSI